MKRGIITLIIGILLVSIFLVHAQDSGSGNPNNPDSAAPASNTNPTIDPKKIDDSIDKELDFPDNVKDFIHSFFKFQGIINLRFFILLILTFALVMMLLKFGVKALFSSLKEWNVWAISFVVTCIVSLAGGIKEGAILLYNFVDVFGFLEGKIGFFKVIGLIVVIVAAVVLIYFVNFLTSKWGEAEEISKAKKAGMEAGLGAAALQEMGKMRKRMVGEES